MNIKKLNGLYELSYFLYDLDEESVNLIDDIESVIRKNSVVRVRQLYDSYPNVLNGEIPVEMNNLLEGLNELTSTENIDYERKY